MRVHIPSPLRRWTGGRDVIEMPVPLDTRMTAAEVIEALAREHPGIRDRVLDEQGELRRHVNIFIDGENARSLGGLSAQVGANSEVWIHPSLSGGAPGEGWTSGMEPRAEYLAKDLVRSTNTQGDRTMQHNRIVTRDEWLAARTQPLLKEKRDGLNK